jgi:hypothetical protein
MVWGWETKKKFFFKLGSTLSLAPPVAGWRPSGAPLFSLAAQQAVSISWKALGAHKWRTLATLLAAPRVREGNSIWQCTFPRCHALGRDLHWRTESGAAITSFLWLIKAAHTGCRPRDQFAGTFFELGPRVTGHGDNIENFSPRFDEGEEHQKWLKFEMFGFNQQQMKLILHLELLQSPVFAKMAER